MRRTRARSPAEPALKYGRAYPVFCLGRSEALIQQLVDGPAFARGSAAAAKKSKGQGYGKGYGKDKLFHIPPKIR